MEAQKKKLLITILLTVIVIIILVVLILISNSNTDLQSGSKEYSPTQREQIMSQLNSAEQYVPTEDELNAIKLQFKSSKSNITDTQRQDIIKQLSGN